MTRQLSDKSQTQNETCLLTPQQVHSVYKCIGNFINYLSKKAQYEWVIADVFSFGTVIRNNTSAASNSEFIPSHVLQMETHISKAMPAKFSESCLRQELLLSKIASVTQLSESIVH